MSLDKSGNMIHNCAGIAGAWTLDIHDEKSKVNNDLLRNSVQIWSTRGDPRAASQPNPAIISLC